MLALVEQAETKQRAKPRIADKRLPDSYVRQREIVGEAVCRRVREIGYVEARRLASEASTVEGADYRLHKEYFRKIVNAREFHLTGYARLCRLAEVLGIDPEEEIAKAKRSAGR